jgi:hypothetical protein
VDQSKDGEAPSYRNVITIVLTTSTTSSVSNTFSVSAVNREAGI